MKNWKLYGILLFLLFSKVSGMAQIRQKETLQDGKTLVMLTPQYLMIKQLRIEIDRKIAKRHWIVFAPHYVQNFEQYQTLSGFGLGVTYKFLLANSHSYLGGGAQITHNTFDNYARDSYYHSDLWLYQSTITQYGFNAIAGHYFRMHPFLFGDIYGGLGYRLAKTESSDGNTHSFSNNYFNFDYKGVMLVIGIRVGIML